MGIEAGLFASRQDRQPRQPFTIADGRRRLPRTGSELTARIAPVEKRDRDYFFSRQWLQDEVERVKKQPLTPGETPWYYLSGTGFWVKEQIAQLMRNTNDVPKEKLPSVLDLELSKVKVDIEKFEEEYLQQMASIRWNLAWGERDGQKRVICPEYGNVLWSDATSKKEREGVVFETLFGDSDKGIIGVEERLRNAPDDTFAVMVSPEGWSGMTDADGRKIRYSESQVYAIHKKADGELETYTFRYDANIFDSEELQRRLGLTVKPEVEQKARIKQTFQNVAFITPEEAARAEQEGRKPIRSFVDLVDLMQETVGGREVAYGGDGNPKSFDEIRAFIADPQFARYHPLTEKLIDRFAEYARWEFSQEHPYAERELNLQIALALAPLQLNRVYREESRKTQLDYQGSGVRITIYEHNSVENLMRRAFRGMNYQEEKHDLKARPGCAGGGEEETNVTSAGASRKGVSGPSSTGFAAEYGFDHEGTCVNCSAGPKPLGPCNICIPCDAGMGGKGNMLVST